MQGFRADRLATLYLFHPARRFQTRAGIPILMYHSISETESRERHPYYRTVTSPRVFDEHLRFLYENGYQVLNLDDVMNPELSSARAAVITFDDGFQDFYTYAFPSLSQYHYSATVFLPTAYIGEATPRWFKGTECMTWSQARELQKAGIEFGSHTVTHPQLKNLEIQDVREEIRGSKETIEDRLCCPIRSFSYPYAFPETDRSFKHTLQELLEESGYDNGVCTTIGTADRSSSRFFMKRLPVNSDDDPRLFRAKLEGGYDWLGVLQFASKVRPITRRETTRS